MLNMMRTFVLTDNVELDYQINIEYNTMIQIEKKKRKKPNEFASNDTKHGQTTVYLMEM